MTTYDHDDVEAQESEQKRLEIEYKKRKRLTKDLEYYAKNNLIIKLKSGKSVKFELNKAQKYIHEKLEEQKRKTGKVRAIILKGRQQGCSTYVGARLYHRVTNTPGQRAYVIAHEASASENLFTIVKNYFENSLPNLKPQCNKDNQRQLLFGKLKSGFKVGTAGSKQSGRSDTVQLIHASEVAFWEHGNQIAAGLLQAVPDLPGTEIILESTSRGRGNYFYSQWRNAQKGESDFITIFVPWYWQDEYRIELPDKYTLTKHEQELKESYGLDDGQVLWRRNKIHELNSDGSDGENIFKREYPFTALEAFEMSDTLSFIKSSHVTRARGKKVTPNPDCDVIMGVDVARTGDDTAFILRKGNKAYNLKLYGDKDNMQVVSLIKRNLDAYPQIKYVYIDMGGGQGVYDRLVELGYNDRVKGIYFGGGASLKNQTKYFNKRAEMYGLLRQWLADGDCSIPDDDLLHEELVCFNEAYHSESRIKLESKDEIKKPARLGRSPDRADALALTFAEDMYDLSKYNDSL